MYIDWTYIILVLPAVLFSLWASRKVRTTYQQYQTQYNSRNITGAQAARFILDRNGLSNIRIEQTSGTLTDHYDPSANVIRLSSGVYGSTSSAAVGVACHEAGHAIQHATNYAPIRLRTAIVPITNIGSKLATPLILVGFSTLAYVGVACFALCTVFQLITLPTEFDASKRALQCIETNNLLYGNELVGAKKSLVSSSSHICCCTCSVINATT